MGRRLLGYWVTGWYPHPYLIPTPRCLCFIPLCRLNFLPLSVPCLGKMATPQPSSSPLPGLKAEKENKYKFLEGECGPCWVRGAIPGPINYRQARNIQNRKDKAYLQAQGNRLPKLKQNQTTTQVFFLKKLKLVRL